MILQLKYIYIKISFQNIIFLVQFVILLYLNKGQIMNLRTLYQKIA
ncbi:hypothetical protein pb186bvf_002104 [Paramecium bursaria]